jgi:glycosyltransferase involved in cell wall biosynthesis
VPNKDLKNITTVCAMSVYSEDRLDWVKQAVESIIKQTVPPTHFVIAIDGPVSSQIQSYLAQVEQSSLSVNLLPFKENCGLAATLNKIIEFILPLEPKYVFRMDADDIAVPKRFEWQLHFMEGRPKVDVLGGSVDEINEHGEIIGHRNLPKTHKRIWQLMSKRCPINHPTVVIRTQMLDKGLRYCEQAGTAEDYYLWVDLAAKGAKFANLGRTLLLYRRCDGFLERRGAQKALYEFKARCHAINTLNRYSFGNYIYAYGVFLLRFMPSRVLKLAYKVDRLWLTFSLRKGG